MDYFEVINLKKEPFSNSPDPDFFFRSNTHVDCLQKIELSIRLKKGLAVVIGDVGTGKTTLCRQMIRNFADDDQIETHLILDPGFRDAPEFLKNLAKMFRKRMPARGTSDLQVKESIKRYLFKRGVDENKTVLLIIDEGQKLSDQCLEILRELLNFETNDHKLLQIVIFAQHELEPLLQDHRNFIDRISLYYVLKPFNFRETISLIRFRLERAGDPNRGYKFLTYPAMLALYLSTGGYPRKIVNLCHRTLLTLIIQNRSTAGWSAIRSNVKRTFYSKNRGYRKGFILTLIIIIFMVAVLFNSETFLSSLKSTFTNNKSNPKRVLNISRDEPVTEKQEIKAERKLQDIVIVKEVTASGPDDKPPEDVISTLDKVYKSHKPDDESATFIDSQKSINLPDFLGELEIGKNETIGRMIQSIYGAFTPDKLKIILENNPGLGNPNKLNIGQRIRFPFINTKTNTLINYYWVEVNRMNTLRDAYAFLKDYPYDDPYVIMIPCWNKNTGLQFSIVLKEYFNKREFAQEELKKLPAGLLNEARILDEWTENTVFCSNPVY